MPRPSIDLGFENGAHGRKARIRFQILNVGHKQNHFQQQVQVLARSRGNLDHDLIAAPVFGKQSLVGEFAFHALHIDSGLVDFVDGDNHGHFRRPACAKSIRWSAA